MSVKPLPRKAKKKLTSGYFILLDSPNIGRVIATAWRQLLRARKSPFPPWEIDHHTWDYVPYSLRTVCGFFNVPQNLYMQGLWDGATVYRPYPRRLESLPVCRCLYKGSTFSSVISRPWVLVRPGLEPAASRTADRRLSNWANRAAVDLRRSRTSFGKHHFVNR